MGKRKEYLRADRMTEPPTVGSIFDRRPLPSFTKWLEDRGSTVRGAGFEEFIQTVHSIQGHPTALDEVNLANRR